MGRKQIDDFKMSIDPRNAMEFWWQKVIKLKTKLEPVKLPKTVIILPDLDNICAFVEPTRKNFPMIKKVFDLVTTTLHDEGFKYPIFMRTSIAASKHDWENSCFVNDDLHLKKNLLFMLNDQLNSLMGPLPQGIILRRFIPLKSTFKAFRGKMPIAKEFRVFSDSGRFLHIQPYWPVDSIKYPNCEDWKDRLSDLCQLDAETEELLIGTANRISADINDAWSFDFCLSESGFWYLTDMAIAHASFIYDPYDLEWRQKSPTDAEIEWIKDYETPRPVMREVDEKYLSEIIEFKEGR